MNKREKIISLIEDYKRAVKKGVDCLNFKKLNDPFFHQRTDENVILIGNGYIEEEKKTYYEFHGISGCKIKWENGEMVDFNLGRAGRYDGFDPWFLFYFYEKNPHIMKKYENVNFDDVKEVIEELNARGNLIYDTLANLYYFRH